jgi:hypothetical protein
MSENDFKPNADRQLHHWFSCIFGENPKSVTLKGSTQTILAFGNTTGGPCSAVVELANGDTVQISVNRPVKYPREFTEWCNKNNVTHKEGLTALRDIASEHPIGYCEEADAYRERIRALLPTYHFVRSVT